MKLTYWTVPCLDDSSVYDIREKTKKAALAKCADLTSEPHLKGAYNPKDIEKVVIEFKDSFELLDNCLGEGGHHNLIIN